jgi:hypothetical protein
VLPVSLDCFCFVFLCLVFPVLPVSLDCFSLSCVPCVASFSGLFFFKTKKNNPEKLATQGTQDKEKQSRETGNTGHTKQSKNNPEKLATQGTQDKEKQSRETGNTGHVSLDCFCFVFLCLV